MALCCEKDEFMKHYRIADLRVGMDSFGRTDRQAEPYLIPVEGDPDIVIRAATDKLHQSHPSVSLDICEYLCTGSSFYTQLLQFNGMMLHSSCVVMDGKAYLFTAPCGTGKSTHTKLWLQQFGDRAYILNDDKPALRFVNGVWFAYGTPWSGKHDINRNTCVPVAGIAVLKQSATNSIRPFSGIEAIEAILSQVVRPRTAEYRILVLEILDQLLNDIPVWELKCNMQPDAALISYEAMSGQGRAQ